MSIIKDLKNDTVPSHDFFFSVECYQCGSSISGYFQNLSGQGSEQHDLTLKLALLRVGGLIGRPPWSLLFLYYCEEIFVL